MKILNAILMCGAVCVEAVQLDVVTYDDFVNDPKTTEIIVEALHEKGVVGIQGVPGFLEKKERYLDAFREFMALPDEVREEVAPTHARVDPFLGYQEGKEKFMREDGSWVVDDLKVSYYVRVPDVERNRWPQEVDLKEPCLELSGLMAEMSLLVMEKAGLFETALEREGMTPLVRMLYYKKSTDSEEENPYWCGAHFDHSVLTALAPATYFDGDEIVKEPEGAGLYIRIGKEYEKLEGGAPDVMLFQVGEFAQLASDDRICATEHRVEKAYGDVERFAVALFMDADFSTVIHSTSKLTEDERYGGEAGDPCSYADWNERTFSRFVVKD